MDTISGLMSVLGRIVTILPLMLFTALFMGRRSVAELPVFDFLVVLILGAVVGADIADPDIEHIYTAFAIVVIGLMQRLVSELSIRSTRFRKWINFDPVVVVTSGKFVVNNLKQIKYSVDNILELLREQGVFNLEEVQLAVLEPNGKLSMYKKPEKAPVTLQDLNISKPKSNIAYPVIIEGKLYKKVLDNLNLEEAWLYKQLDCQGKTIDEIFFASVDENRHLHISTKNETDKGANILLNR